MKKPVIAIVTAISLLAMLCADGRGTSGTPEGFQAARLGVPSHAWRLEASAPAKTWESPSLHQSTRSKATPERLALTVPTGHTGTASALAAANAAVPPLVQLPRRISPRAPPQRSIAL